MNKSKLKEKKRAKEGGMGYEGRLQRGKMKAE